MSTGLGREDIRALLDDLSAELEARGARAELFLVGGAALAVAYDATRATRDLDEPARRIEVGPAVAWRGGRGEVIGQAARQIGSRPRPLRTGPAVREQVERQRHPVPRRHGLDLMAAVGVERDERQVPL